MNNYQSIATINAPEFINLEPLEINPMMSKCEIKVLYLGQNRNGTSINKEAAAQMAKTLRGAPIVGYYKDNSQDFFDHGEQIIYDGEGVHFNTLTKPYGFVAPDAKVWFQEFEEFNDAGESTVRVYMMTTGYLWTGQYKEAQQIFNEGGKPQSMELDENSISGFWSKEDNSDMEFFIINDAMFSKLCILGDDVEPCFEGASITAPNISKTFSLDDDFKNTLFKMMKELQYTLQGGNYKMEDENKKKSVDSSEIIEEATNVENPIDETPADNNVEEVNAPETTESDNTSETNNDTVTEATPEVSDNADAGAESGSGSDSGSDSGDAGASDYAKKDDEDKKEEEKNEDNKEDKTNDEDSSDKKDDDEKKKKDDKYSLLLVQFEELQQSYSALKEELAETNKALDKYKNAEKDALIAEFFMLSDEDKKDVIDHKAEYSLAEIKSKLAVLCYDKKVTYTRSDESVDDMTYNVQETNDSMPEWLQAVEKHKSQQ